MESTKHLRLIKTAPPQVEGPITRLGLKRPTTSAYPRILFLAAQLILIAAMVYLLVY